MQKISEMYRIDLNFFFFEYKNIKLRLRFFVKILQVINKKFRPKTLALKY